MSVGLNIGGSLFGLTTVAAGLTGPSLPLALLISALPAILAVLPFSILASAAPTTGASYRYVQLLSPSLAYTTALAALICVMIGTLPLMGRVFGLFFQAILPVDPVISGLAVLTVFYLVNVAGIRSTVRVQVILVLLVEVAANFMSAVQLGYFVVAGALLACATSINTAFTLVARILLAISTEGLLPRFLSQVNIERGSPVGALTLTYVLAALTLLSQSSLLFFGTLTNFPIIVVVTLVSVLVITLPYRFPELYRHSAFHPPPVVLWVVCGTVIAANVTIFVFLAGASHLATWTYAGLLLVFGLYAISRRKTLATLIKIAPAMRSEGSE